MIPVGTISETVELSADTHGRAASEEYFGVGDNHSGEEIPAAGGYARVVPLGSGFSAPTGVAVGASGNVFVADRGHNAVKEIVAADSSVVSLGSGFSNPRRSQ